MVASVETAAPVRPPRRRIARRNRWGEWVLSVVVAVAVVLLVNSLATNERLGWDTVGQYLFDPLILEGVGVTLSLAIGCMVLAIVVGLISALMGQSHSPVLKGISLAYVWVFRGTPVLVQLIFWYNLALLFPRLAVGVPFGPEFWSWDTNEVISPLVAAVVGLTLAEGAFMSEIIRGGVNAVDRGQVEAAQALGMTRRRTMRRIVLPQATRIIVPPTGNEFITMLKGTALVAVIAVPDLLFTAQGIYNVNYQVTALLIVASLWYLAMTSVATVGQYFLERHYARRG